MGSDWGEYVSVLGERMGMGSDWGECVSVLGK